MLEDYSSYYKLWDTVVKFQEQTKEWTTAPMHTVVASEVEGLLDTWFRSSLLMIKDPPAKGGFDSQHTQTAKKVCVVLRDQIDAFRKRFPFLRAFSQPFILDRHWDELFTRMKATAPAAYKDITMTMMTAIGVLDFEEDFEELSAAAQKENTLKKSLKTMKEDWVEIALDTVEYKDTGAHMLRGIDDVQAVLDDHIVKTQGIRSSPFCKPFEAEVHEWEAKLLYIQDFVDQTLLVQRTWMSLEPIFVSEDIKRQLPTESAGFAEVDAMFRQRMKQVTADTHCLAIAGIANMRQTAEALRQAAPAMAKAKEHS